MEADLADREKTQDLADDLVARGSVVGIVNNVGLARHERVDAVDPDVFAMVMDLNVRPALQLTQAFLPGMRAARFGRIINITSLVTRGLAFRRKAAKQDKGERRTKYSEAESNNWSSRFVSCSNGSADKRYC
jgi:3-oxoacyl-[acyl-carrier protein] reductase